MVRSEAEPVINKKDQNHKQVVRVIWHKGCFAAAHERFNTECVVVVCTVIDWWNWCASRTRQGSWALTRCSRHQDNSATTVAFSCVTRRVVYSGNCSHVLTTATRPLPSARSLGLPLSSGRNGISCFTAIIQVNPR